MPYVSAALKGTLQSENLACLDSEASLSPHRSFVLLRCNVNPIENNRRQQKLGCHVRNVTYMDFQGLPVSYIAALHACRAPITLSVISGEIA